MELMRIAKWPAKQLFYAFESYKKKDVKKRLPHIKANEASMTVVSMVRNEALLLPFFLSYYDKLGVDRFVFLDHGSTDDTPSIIDAHDRSVRITVSGNFIYKRAWLSGVLEACCIDRWCLVLDADEFLVYPRMHDVPISTLIEYFEESGHDALQCTLLDMFPKCNIIETNYQRGQDLLAAAPYFDASLSARKKAFDVEPCLRKMPLFRFAKGRMLGKGQHVVIGAHRSNISGCLLHFKFLQDFVSKIRYNTLLGVSDVDYGRELKAYKATMEQDPALTLYSSDSVRYESPDQLVELGLMRSCAAFEDFSSTVAGNVSR